MEEVESGWRSRDQAREIYLDHRVVDKRLMPSPDVSWCLDKELWLGEDAVAVLRASLRLVAYLGLSFRRYSHVTRFLEMVSSYLDYRRIGPSHRFLKDEAVLYQAWRKSVNFIRRHNWYSDVLELDIAALDTRRTIRECSRLMENSNWSKYEPEPMRLVPVPKRAEWSIQGRDWRPQTDVRWRPLAHLSVRDQTLATAAMVCLANLVETEQGDTRTPTDPRHRDLHRHAVSSYGNRLYCQWTKEGAKFHWGNSKTYREYFEDYRAFVARSNDVVQELSSNRRLAIVHIDIEKFYDCIDRNVLIDKLRTLAKRKSPDQMDEGFFRRLHQVFAWSWHRQDEAAVTKYFPNCSSSGIPQGLVAGGFFANAYMLEFDRAMRRSIGDTPTKLQWQLIDYCRYVDDMRLVIRHDNFSDLKSIREDVTKFVQERLQKRASGLRINPDKTDVLPAIARPSVVQVGGTMESIQSQVSGPLDPTSASQVLATLNALFPIAEQAAARTQKQSDDGKELLKELQFAELDVRPDTVERFAANRWRRVYRSLRAMADQDNKNEARELKALDEKARLFSRTLIRRWVSDPSNVRLLRVAFDVLPDVEHLNRYVLSLLQPHLFDENASAQHKYVAWYTVAELLKAGATETGFVWNSDELPSTTNVAAYRARLAEVAERCQQNAKVIPWYLRQQSALFLLIHGKHMKLGAECGSHYRVTMNCLRGKWSPEPETLRSDLPAALRAVDLGADPVPLRDRISNAASRLPDKTGRAILRLFDSYTRPQPSPPIELPQPLSAKPTPLDLALNHPDSPFRQENAALILARELLARLKDDTEVLDPRRITITCEEYQSLCDPRRIGSLHLGNVDGKHSLKPPSVPSWCRPSHRWRLGLAMTLTQALRQPAENSIARQMPQEPRYRPARVRIPMFQNAIATSRGQLGGPAIAVSPWMEELLMHLGQWPGFQPFCDLVNLSEDFSREDVLSVIEERLTHQAEIFGKASGLPIYEVPIRFRDLKKGKDPFTVMLVQTALPRKDDFAKNGLELSDPKYRRAHRRHLASVLKLIQQTIDTRATHAHARRVDLVVLPELSVHPQDLSLIRLLISKTRAWVFCGLVFQPHRGKVVNRGVWLIPTFRQDGTRRTRSLLRFDQGKHHLTAAETSSGVSSCRDCQWVMAGRATNDKHSWKLSGAICYDATDLRLAADLRDVTDGFVVAALNQDVPTFDNMIAALHYHMYQHVVLVNSGEFGGSTVQAPYVKHFVKNRVHTHGSDQVVISICEMNLLDFRSGSVKPGDPERKTPPAGFSRS